MGGEKKKMILNKGRIIYEYEKDLEYKRLVEEFIDTANLTRTAMNQFVNTVISLRDVKERISINREANLFYFISIRRLLDTIELKNILKDVTEQREAIQKGEEYLEEKIEEYISFMETDSELKRTEIIKNMFIGYAKMYSERVEKQISAITKYLIRVKKVEVVKEEEDKDYLANLESDILQNDTKLKIVTSELHDIWLNISDSILENIIEEDICHNSELEDKIEIEE